MPLQVVDYFNLPEQDFLNLLKDKIIQTGNIADVFPAMVAYNVPLFAVKNLWPSQYQEFSESPKFPSLAIAEKGWQGKIYNIKSKLSQVKDKYILNYEKSYVIDCEIIYMLVKFNDDFALIRIENLKGEPGQDWLSRNEADLVLKTSEGKIVDHFIIKGESSLVDNYIQPLKSKEYARIALSIPRREASSLAVLALGLLEHLGLKYSHTLLEAEKNIMLARQNNELNKDLLKNSKDILNEFYLLVEGIAISPFWYRIKKILN